MSLPISNFQLPTSNLYNMPVEIRKLVIQAKVAETPPKKHSGPAVAPPALSPEEIREIVKLCVKQTLQILQREKIR